MNKSKQINTEPTALVRIGANLHISLKIKAAKVKKTIKALIEEALEGVNLE